MKFDKSMKSYFPEIVKVLAHRKSPSTELDRMLKDSDPKPLRMIKKIYANSGFITAF